MKKDYSLKEGISKALTKSLKIRRNKALFRKKFKSDLETRLVRSLNETDLGYSDIRFDKVTIAFPQLPVSLQHRVDFSCRMDRETGLWLPDDKGDYIVSTVNPDQQTISELMLYNHRIVNVEIAYIGQPLDNDSISRLIIRQVRGHNKLFAIRSPEGDITLYTDDEKAHRILVIYSLDNGKYKILEVRLKGEWLKKFKIRTADDLLGLDERVVYSECLRNYEVVMPKVGCTFGFGREIRRQASLLGSYQSAYRHMVEEYSADRIRDNVYGIPLVEVIGNLEGCLWK